MKRLVLVALSMVLFTSSLVLAQRKVREEDLGQKYRSWLNLTSYIILPQEKEVFLKLTNDRDRDIFIESFWKQRDPTPGTPQNEYQDEIIRRFDYAAREFHKDTSREGWLTDMGKFYIILGPPNSRERFDGQREIRPCQVWYYYGDVRKGLPTYFALVFFKRSGVGEYTLYDPLTDGPAELLRDTFGLSVVDNYGIYEKLREFAPTLAPLSLSMIPGETPHNFQPSLESNLILTDILNSPTKDVNPSYATHFLNFKGLVSTEYLTNFVDCDSTIAVLPDPVLDINFLHFCLTPKKVSVDYFETGDQYYCSYSVDVSLRRGEKIFYQYSKEFPFYFSPAEEPVVTDNGLSIQDSFPVIAGTYQLTVLLKNSVAKEFSVVEKDLTWAETGATPRISEAVLGFKLEDSPGNAHVPFRVLGKKLAVDPKTTFGAGDEIALLLGVLSVPETLWRNGEVRAEVQGLGAENPSRNSFRLRLSDYAYHRSLSLAHTFPAAGLAPDYYDLRFSLVDGGGTVLDEKKVNFIVTAGRAIARPITIAKTFPLANAYLYFYTLAGQYDKSGETEKAERLYQKSHEMAPDYKEGIVFFANFLIRNGKSERALELAEKIAGEQRLRFDYYLIKGRALTRLGRYGPAIDQLLEANKIYNSDTRLLNALGLCFSKTGDKARALDVLRASLRLNPEQPEIKKLVEEIQK